MTNSVQVLEYLKSALPGVGLTQAMKLLYYTQAWSLAWTGREAFSDPVIAWQYGPATLNAFQSFRGVIPQQHGLDPELRATVDSVVKHYGHMPAWQLRDLSHSEQPWRGAYYSLDGGHEAGKPISLTDMKREYTMQALKGVGPTKPSMGAAIVDQAEFEKLLNRVRTEDREALDALASR